MASKTPIPKLDSEEREKYHDLISDAFDKANDFTGSEETYQDLMDALILVEEFVRARNDDTPSEEIEAKFSKQSGHISDRFNSVSSIIGHAANRVYGMLSRLTELQDILNGLKMGGALIDYSDRVYVLTDQSFPSGGEGGELDRNLTDFRQQPRLAMLVKQLGLMDIYTDDLIIRVGKVFEDKVRKLPYVVVEIPSIGKQVAVCDQYGESTFVSQNILPPNVWASYTKKQLQALEGVKPVPFTDSWPFKVSNLLAHGTDAMTPEPFKRPDKVDLEAYEKARPKPRNIISDFGLVKQAVFEFYQETGSFLRRSSKDDEGGKVELRIGDETITAPNLDQMLKFGRRGLLEISGLPGLNTLLADEYGEDYPYVNHLKQPDLDFADAKAAVIKYYTDTGKFLTQKSQDDNGKAVQLDISDQKIVPSNLNTMLTKGTRGLPALGGLAGLHRIIAKDLGDEYPYVNIQDQPDLDFDDAKAAMIKYYEDTGEFLTQQSKDDNGEGVELTIKDKDISARNLQYALHQGNRGLPAVGGIVGLNSMIAEEHGDLYPYVNTHDQPDLDFIDAKAAIIQYYADTGEFLTQHSKDDNGKAVQLNISDQRTTPANLDHMLTKGTRGLPAIRGIAGLNIMIAEERGDEYPYVNMHDQPDLDFVDAKAAVIKYYTDTGEFFATSRKNDDGTDVRLNISGQSIASANLDRMLTKGTRGLPAVGGIAGLNRMVAEERGNNYPYDNQLNQPDLNFFDAKAAIIQYYAATGEFLTQKSNDDNGKAVQLNISGQSIAPANLDHMLKKGTRGLPAIRGIAGLNGMIAKERGDEYPYVNIHDQPDLDFVDAKAAVIKYYTDTGEFLSENSKTIDGANVNLNISGQKINVSNLKRMLTKGTRGLPAVGGIVGLNSMIAEERGDEYPYFNLQNQPDINRDELKVAMLLDWLTYREPPIVSGERSHDLFVSGQREKTGNLNANARRNTRGLAPSDTIANIKKELLVEYPWLEDVKPDDEEEPYEVTTKPDDFDF